MQFRAWRFEETNKKKNVKRSKETEDRITLYLRDDGSTDLCEEMGPNFCEKLSTLDTSHEEDITDFVFFTKRHRSPAEANRRYRRAFRTVSSSATCLFLQSLRVTTKKKRRQPYGEEEQRRKKKRSTKPVVNAAQLAP